MKCFVLNRAKFLLIAVLLIGGLGLFVTQKSYADPLETLKARLPDLVAGWRVELPDRFYDEKTLFDYIDGGAEVYRSYNMKGCLSRRYILPGGPALVLDIFDMGSSEDAFGVSTHDLDGEQMSVGAEALYRAGWLSFWKDRFFISLYAETETDASKGAVIELATRIASLIPARGTRPALLSRLPTGGLRKRGIRFLHDDMVLNYHYYLSDENILLLGPETDAVLAFYQREGGRAAVLLVAYPGEEKAAQALTGFLGNYLPDADSEGLARLENDKWSAARAKGNVVAVILEAETRQLARDLIEEILEVPSRN